jgi:hypothetical protein
VGLYDNRNFARGALTEALGSRVRNMKFWQLYQETMQLWPSSIDISNGELQKDGGIFPNLSKIWTEVEDQTATSTEWSQLMVWAIYCGWHKAALISFRAGQREVDRRQLDEVYVEYKFSECFYADDLPCWADMRANYENDLGTFSNPNPREPN